MARCADAIDTFRVAREDAEETQRSLNEKEAELKQAKKENFDRTRSLHPEMPQLLELIGKNAKAFGKTPLGPLGLAVQVKPEHAALGPAIESAIGVKTLLCFIVDSPADESALRKLVGQLKPTRYPLAPFLSISIRQGWDQQPRHKTTRKGGGPTTLIEAIDILAKGNEADAWFNLLLDVSNAELRMVFDDVDEAKKIILSSKDARPEGYVRESNYAAGGLKIFRRGKTEGFEPFGSTRRILVTDKKSVLAALEAEAAAAKRAAADAKDKALRADAARKQAEAAEVGKRKEMKQETQKLDAQMIELDRTQSDSATDHVAQQLQDTERQMRNSQDKAKRLKLGLERAKEQLASNEAEFEPLKVRFEEAKRKYEEMMETERKLGQEVQQARAPLKKALTSRNAQQKELVRAQKVQQAAADKVEELRGWIARMEPGVEENFGPRVHDPQRRTVEALKKEQKQLQAKIAAQEKLYGGKNLVELAEEAKKSRELADAGTEEIRTVKEMGEKGASAAGASITQGRTTSGCPCLPSGTAGSHGIVLTCWVPCFSPHIPFLPTP